MKNRKTVVVAFLLVAVMLLGVGYAALADELELGGTVAVKVEDVSDAFEADIYFSKVISGDGCEATIHDAANGDKNDGGTITVKANAIKEVGGEVIATYTIKNDNDLPIVITKPTLANALLTNTNTTYFDVYVNWVNDTMTVAANSTADVVVTVKLIKTPTSEQAATFTITFNAAVGTP